MIELNGHPPTPSCVTLGYSASQAIGLAVECHRAFIQQSLGSPLEDTVILKLDFDLSDIALDHVCGTDVQPAWNTHLSRMRSRVQEMDIPRDCAPIVSVGNPDPCIEPLWKLRRVPPPMRPMKLRWEDCPIALRLKDLEPIVFFKVAYLEGPSSYETTTAHVVVTPKRQVSQVLRAVALLDGPTSQLRMHTVNGPTRPVKRLDWGDLVLGTEAVQLLKDDFETFWSREDWFHQSNLPFRRGYLLHGPLGNGKTSAIRAMLTSRGITGYTMRLFELNCSDSDLEGLFDEAGRNCPCIVVLEDLDRAFPRTGETKTALSLQCLLNCLDGVSTPEGIVVVATANEPSILDPAILRRPGRFDRVIHFPNPDRRLRQKYLTKTNPRLATEDLRPVIDHSDGLSFAQLRESYVLAGQKAFQRGENIAVQDLTDAVLSLRGAYPASKPGTGGGFRP